MPPFWATVFTEENYSKCFFLKILKVKFVQSCFSFQTLPNFQFLTCSAASGAAHELGGGVQPGRKPQTINRQPEASGLSTAAAWMAWVTSFKTRRGASSKRLPFFAKGNCPPNSQLGKSCNFILPFANLSPPENQELAHSWLLWLKNNDADWMKRCEPLAVSMKSAFSPFFFFHYVLVILL